MDRAGEGCGMWLWSLAATRVQLAAHHERYKQLTMSSPTGSCP
jgi:hypothetical protein